MHPDFYATIEQVHKQHHVCMPPGAYGRGGPEILLFALEHQGILEQMGAFQEAINAACERGDLHYLEWLMEKQRDAKIPSPLLSSFEPLKRATKVGFGETIAPILNWLGASSLDAQQRDQLLALALEVGFPHIFNLFLEQGFSASHQQLDEYHALSTALKKEFEASAPAPLNQKHDEAHGGRSNAAIYQKEYQEGVAYTLFYMRKEGSSFSTLIENLGHRRRRMAILGKLDYLYWYGVPTYCRLYTPFWGLYGAYGKKIHDKYSPKQFPIQVIAEIKGKQIPLTTITQNNWQHPHGEHRDEILEEVDRLCRIIKIKHYPKDKTNELACDLGKIIWLLSHAPPFLRGTPTVISMLMDAFWLFHKRKPLTKVPDLNCEALACDRMEDFAAYMYHRTDLPREIDEN